MLKKYDFRRYNYWLVLMIVILSVFGAFMIRSASAHADFRRQLMGLAVSMTVMLVVSLIDYNFILKLYWLIYSFNIILLLMVKFMGKSSHGAKRWIVIVPEPNEITLQPSEFSKVFLILILAKLLSSYRDKINDFRYLAILTIILAVPVLLIATQPDLSTTILIVGVLVTMIYCSGLYYRNILIIIGCMIPITLVLFLYIQMPNQKLLQSYQVNRINAFLHGEESEEYDDDRYQQEFSMKAIGSGQLYGKGYDNDDSSSIKNLGYIAEAQNDFIFAVIGEELGFIGCCCLILLIGIIVFECVHISIRAKDFAGRLICCGMAAFIAYQSFINIGVATVLLPNTGIPLPFISKGLSSLIGLFGGMGVVLNISLQRTEN